MLIVLENTKTILKRVGSPPTSFLLLVQMSQACKWAFRARKKAKGMAQEPVHRNLPPPKSPVYLVLLWPDTLGHWEGRIKDAKTGTEYTFSEIEELLSWLENHKQRRLA